MKEKDELLQIFPSPVLITKYEHSIEEEFKKPLLTSKEELFKIKEELTINETS